MRVRRSRATDAARTSRSSRPRNSPTTTDARLQRDQGRPFLISLGWSLRDYVKRVWDNSAEDNVLFLAGGITFNLLLAAVPFLLLLASGLTLMLPLFVRGTPIAGGADPIIEFRDLLLRAPGPGTTWRHDYSLL